MDSSQGSVTAQQEQCPLPHESPEPRTKSGTAGREPHEEVRRQKPGVFGKLVREDPTMTTPESLKTGRDRRQKLQLRGPRGPGDTGHRTDQDQEDSLTEEAAQVGPSAWWETGELRLRGSRPRRPWDEHLTPVTRESSFQGKMKKATMLFPPSWGEVSCPGLHPRGQQAFQAFSYTGCKNLGLQDIPKKGPTGRWGSRRT